VSSVILWRHAEAEVESCTGKDADRALTKRGRKDALKMAKWLLDHWPANTTILCSPAQRCLETLGALQQLNGSVEVNKISLKITLAESLAIGSSVEDIAKQALNNDADQTILLIGHQPNLGQLIARFLGMDEGACAVKKGAIWWLRQRQTQTSSSGQSQYSLYTVQLPRY
jgi:phosphohistidine phosphatase